MLAVVLLCLASSDISPGSSARTRAGYIEYTAPPAAETTSVSNTAMLANGALTLGTQPAYPCKLTITETVGGAAVTAGTLALVRDRTGRHGTQPDDHIERRDTYLHFSRRLRSPDFSNRCSAPTWRRRVGHDRDWAVRGAWASNSKRSCFGHGPEGKRLGDRQHSRSGRNGGHGRCDGPHRHSVHLCERRQVLPVLVQLHAIGSSLALRTAAW